MSFSKLSKNHLWVILSRPTYAGPIWQTGIICNSSGSRFLTLCWERLLISNMQKLETKQKALKCLWPTCKDCQVPAVVWSFCPLNKWPQLMQQVILEFRAFFHGQLVMCSFWNWNGSKETGLWKEDSYIISKERCLSNYYKCHLFRQGVP